MGRKKVDKRIRILIENCVVSRQRSMFFIVGEKSNYQSAVLYHVASKAREIMEIPKPKVLWCYKRNFGFDRYLHKKSKLLKKESTRHTFSDEDVFNYFLLSSDIHFCHYSATSTILGQTFGMLVIQDFEALTPNILSLIMECVEGSGIIAFLLPNIQVLQDLPSINMDSHSRYVTSSHPKVIPRFNKRFVLSLTSCQNCLVLNDNQQILLAPPNLLPEGSCHQNRAKSMETVLKHSNSHLSDYLWKVSSLCCTVEQIDALLKFNNALQDKLTAYIISLTSARGRGKSSALGLAVSVALFLKYSNVFVTAPHLENLQTFFSFLIKGLESLNYKEEVDYDIKFNYLENSKLISGVRLFESRQTVNYVAPTEFFKVGNADLIVIDEVAAIPLPIVKNWLNWCTVLMASTVNGYEGTGRSLSLKLIDQLRKQASSNIAAENLSCKDRKPFILCEVAVNEAIRYSSGDCVEAWLNSLFCLDVPTPHLMSVVPERETCRLYYVNRDILFSYHKASELFLQHLTSLFVSSHYKNSPNDLIMMADAPSHHIFCLLPPVDPSSCHLPEILCAIQVSFEGRITKENTNEQQLSYGKRASGDLIPWIISQQFQDNNFLTLSGARIVRIATHPEYQRMGYGQRALHLLCQFFERTSTEIAKSTNSSDLLNKYEVLECDGKVKSQQRFSFTLLLEMDEINPIHLDYIGVSYGLTSELLRFWKRCDFFPFYLRQTASDVTGEHSCIMMKIFKSSTLEKKHWFSDFLSDFLERFIVLLSSAFKNLPASLALNILHSEIKNSVLKKTLPKGLVRWFLTTRSLQRISAYCNHQVDYHLIFDLLPMICKLYFLNYFQEFRLSSLQEAVLLCMGIQNKSVEDICSELNMDAGQVMKLFMKTMNKILRQLHILNTPEENFLQTETETLNYVSSKRKRDNETMKRRKHR